MNELGSDDTEDDAEEAVGNDDVIIVDEDDDDVIDLTGEVNVESLVAKLDATPKDDLERKRQIRKRLEELRDSREELESTYNFNLDDEL